MNNDRASGKTVRMARRAQFSSAHFYSQKNFTEDLNKSTFGKCFTPHGHGHNYLLEAFFEGVIDQKTGLIANLLDIDELLKAVVHKLDHQHLNFDVPEFRDLVPTTENLAKFCFEVVSEQQRNLMPSVPMRLYKIRLFENDDLWVEYSR